MKYESARDPISFLTHYLGMIFSFIGLFILLTKSILTQSDISTMIGVFVFSVSMILLYWASTKYHYSNGNNQKIEYLRKIDHAMIFVLIAGSYTPLILKYYEAPINYYFLTYLWIIVIIGSILKFKWINMPRFISTCIYVFLGCSICLNLSIFTYIPVNILYCIYFTAFFYLVGAFIYIIKKPNLSQKFGFHELFHIFILLGSFSYFLAVFQMI